MYLQLVILPVQEQREMAIYMKVKNGINPPGVGDDKRKGKEK